MDGHILILTEKREQFGLSYTPPSANLCNVNTHSGKETALIGLNERHLHVRVLYPNRTDPSAVKIIFLDNISKNELESSVADCDEKSSQ